MDRGVMPIQIFLSQMNFEGSSPNCHLNEQLSIIYPLLVSHLGRKQNKTLNMSLSKEPDRASHIKHYIKALA